MTYSIAKTRQLCWHLSWPAMLSGVMIPLMGMVDMAVVGRLPNSKAMGAVALGAWLFDLFYWSFGFLRMGTTGLSAQAYGRNDRSELILQWIRPVFLALVLGGILFISAPLYLYIMMPWLRGNDQALKQLCQDYFMARVWGGPAVLVNYVCVGWLLGVQKSKWVLLIQSTLAFCNIALSLILGDMIGLIGVAYASAIAQVIVAIIASYICYRTFAMSIWTVVRDYTFKDKHAWYQLWNVNRNLMLRSILLLLAFGAFHSVSVRQNSDLLAANALLLHLQTLQAFILDGFAHAMVAMVGQALGAKDKLQLQITLKVGWQYSTCASVIIAILYLLFFTPLISCFTTHMNIIATAQSYWMWAVISPICSAPCFLLDGVMIGATLSRTMFIAMGISVICYLICLFILPIMLGNHGIFLSLMIFMLLRALTLYPSSQSLLSHFKYTIK